MKLTYQIIKNLNPCYDPNKYIQETWQGSLIDVLSMKNVPAKDRLWVCVSHGFITDRQLHLYGLACARMSEKYTTDTRVKQCNDVIEKFLRGKATRQELKEAQARHAQRSMGRNKRGTRSRERSMGRSKRGTRSRERSMGRSKRGTRSRERSMGRSKRGTRNRERSMGRSKRSRRGPMRSLNKNSGDSMITLDDNIISPTWFPDNTISTEIRRQPCQNS